MSDLAWVIVIIASLVLAGIVIWKLARFDREHQPCGHSEGWDEDCPSCGGTGAQAAVDPYSRLRSYESSLGYLVDYAKPSDHGYMVCYEPEINTGPCQFCAIASILESVQAVLEEVRP